MLTQDRLVDLYGELSDRRVLTIYIDGDEHDPAERTVWKTRIEKRIEERRRALNGTGDEESAAFEAAADRLMRELRSFPNFIPDRGWVGFATEEGVAWADTVPVPMPDLVAWETGLRAAPYIRALKQGRPVVVAMADRRHARVFTYRYGEVTESDEVTADVDLEDMSDSSISRRGSEHSGTRGQTATEEAQRQVEVKAERMLKEVVGRIEERVGSDGLIVVGGTRETGARLLHHLPDRLLERAVEVRSLHLEMTASEIRAQAERAASELTQRLQAALAEEVVNLAKSRARGVLGDEKTAEALLERRVDTLVLSRRFIHDAPDRADHMIGTAFQQGARVEEISGPGAELIDREGEGVGARLRW